MPEQHLTARYTSPDSKKLFSTSLPSLPDDGKNNGVEEKTAYLNALRTNIAQIQSDVNVFLTKRMDDDKAAESGKSGANRKAREKKEEEMYGEEDPEADDG